MKNLIFMSCFILFLGCNLSVSRNEKFSDIDSLQLKTSFVDLKNKKVDLTSYEGKKIVINHWATWCGPCIKEMPGIERAQKILKNYDYIFLLVSDEKVSKISEFKNDNKYEFNFLKSVRSNETLGIYSLPTSYIFDENGIKIETIVGTIIWDSETIINKLKIL
ncbi:TlpA family protein disulfide reductase [bacterium]|jgi:thiol-disulfide isomerase/thioredoxin|nr:TlpA family protein disulfide reductase [Flavobacteriaceae bacterium]MDA9642768.1 TlpA family protein disulfide reductase [bacterium]MDA9668858.1 TlpA family protein disulfide reductase [Flavobacteriaceae bacterium]